MKALSIYAPYVDEIARGVKLEEYRSWATRHRGDLLICSAARKSGDVWLKSDYDSRIDSCRLQAHEDEPGWYRFDWSGLYVCGHAICIVNVTDCEQAGVDGYAWRFDKVRLIQPVPVKGTQRLFEVDDDRISVIRGKYLAARRLWYEMKLIDKI